MNCQERRIALPAPEVLAPRYSENAPHAQKGLQELCMREAERPARTQWSKLRAVSPEFRKAKRVCGKRQEYLSGKEQRDTRDDNTKCVVGSSRLQSRFLRDTPYILTGFCFPGCRCTSHPAEDRTRNARRSPCTLRSACAG
jgi:hypothetical protein